jgi:thiol-disulfide isomerase/thioredoxin
MRFRLAFIISVSLLSASVSGTEPPTDLPRASAEQLQACFLRDATVRPRVIHLWASWCVPCVAEWSYLAPAMRRWASRQVDVVTIALEEDGNGEAAARVLMEVGDVPGFRSWTTLDDIVPRVRSLDPEWDGSLPTTLLLSVTGKVVLVERGITKTKDLEAEINRLLRKKTNGKRRERR